MILGCWHCGHNPCLAVNGSHNKHIAIHTKLIMPVKGMNSIKSSDSPQSGKVKIIIRNGAAFVFDVASVLRVGWCCVELITEG